MKKILKKNAGFTLIELMIVVAIIGILAAIAIPAYQDYTVRAKMSEAIAAAAPAKTGVSEFFQSEGELPTSANEAGFEPNIDSQFVQSVLWDANEVIKVVINDMGGTTGPGDIPFNLSPITSPAAVDWSCLSGGDCQSGDCNVDRKYLPANCR